MYRLASSWLGVRTRPRANAIGCGTARSAARANRRSSATIVQPMTAPQSCPTRYLRGDRRSRSSASSIARTSAASDSRSNGPSSGDGQ
ncbi:MAG: hypothetical protein U0414_23430 [Polyangiaceae bacterium]